MRTGTKKILATAALVGLTGFAASSRASSISVNFDTAGDFTNNFNQFTQVTGQGPPQTFSPNPFTENSANGGVLNTGSVTDNLAAGQDGTATYKLQGFDFSQVGQQVSESIIFKTVPTFTAATTGSGQRMVQLGFLTTTTGGFNGNSNQLQGATPFPAFISARISTQAAGTGGTAESVKIEIQQKATGTGNNGLGATTLATASSAFNVLSNEFYQLSIVATQNGGGAYSLTASLQDMGLDGATVTGSPTTFSALAAQATGMADMATTVFGGFRATATNAVASYDNFSEAPEPASIGLLGLGALGLLARRRRA